MIPPDFRGIYLVGEEEPREIPEPGGLPPAVLDGRRPDAYYCGQLVGAIRSALACLRVDNPALASETLTDALRRYYDESGFLPPDAVDVEGEGPLPPGVREINGQRFYSAAWL